MPMTSRFIVSAIYGCVCVGRRCGPLGRKSKRRGRPFLWLGICALRGSNPLYHKERPCQLKKLPTLKGNYFTLSTRPLCFVRRREYDSNNRGRCSMDSREVRHCLCGGHVNEVAEGHPELGLLNGETGVVPEALALAAPNQNLLVEPQQWCTVRTRSGNSFRLTIRWLLATVHLRLERGLLSYRVVNLASSRRFDERLGRVDSLHGLSTQCPRALT